MSEQPRAARAVVELAGLPGSGKSTIATAMRDALAQRGVACRIADAGVSASAPRGERARRRLGIAGREALAHPAATVALLRAVRATHQESVRDALAGAVQWTVVRRAMERSRTCPGVHLLEEGAVQTLWTLGLRSSGAPEQLAALLDQACVDQVVVVEAPVQTIAARLEERPSRHSRTQLLPAAERVAELERGLVLLDTLLARHHGRQLRLLNDGAASPEELGRRAADWVLRSLGGREGAEPVRGQRCQRM